MFDCNKVLGSALGILIAVLLPAESRASIFWAGDEFAELCRSSQALQIDEIKKAMRSLFQVPQIEQRLQLKKVIKPPMSEMRRIFDISAQRGLAAIDIFTDPHFTAGAPCTLLLDEQILSEIHRDCDLHSPWMIKPQIEDGREVTMRHLLLGNGSLVIAYPLQQTATVSVNDYLVKLFLGLQSDNFEYEPYTLLRIENNKVRGLFDIKVLAEGDSQLSEFVGPFNANIRSLQVENDYVLVASDRGKTKIAKKKIECQGGGASAF